MPLLSVLRFIFMLISLAVLGIGAYLLWSWYDGELVQTTEGLLVREREDWQLWLGLAVLAWSVLGKFVVLPLLARPDSDALQDRREPGTAIEGAKGSRLHVETTGRAEGTPIILTHGAASEATVWYYVRRDLAGEFQLVAWDLPGLGKSRAGQRDLGPDAYAADLRQVIATVGRPVVLVGHSMGGMTIQTLARDNPELFGREIAGVVLINTTYTNPLRTMILSRLLLALQRPLIEPMSHLAIWLQPLVWLGNWQSYLSGGAHIATRFGFSRRVTRSQLEHMTLLSTRNPPASLSKGNLGMFHWDATGALSRIGVPVLILAGGKDIITKPEASRQMVEQGRGAELKLIETANHMGFLDHADLYNRAIAEFARTISARSS